MERTNNKSISSLILGIVSIFLSFIGLIFVGLIFGIMGIVMSYKAVKEIKNSEEKGIGLAVSGRVISIIGICCDFFTILVLVTFSPAPPF